MLTGNHIRRKGEPKIGHVLSEPRNLNIIAPNAHLLKYVHMNVHNTGLSKHFSGQECQPHDTLNLLMEEWELVYVSYMSFGIKNKIQTTCKDSSYTMYVFFYHKDAGWWAFGNMYLLGGTTDTLIKWKNCSADERYRLCVNAIKGLKFGSLDSIYNKIESEIDFFNETTESEELVKVMNTLPNVITRFDAETCQEIEQTRFLRLMGGYPMLEDVQTGMIRRGEAIVAENS